MLILSSPGPAARPWRWPKKKKKKITALEEGQVKKKTNILIGQLRESSYTKKKLICQRLAHFEQCGLALLLCPCWPFKLAPKAAIPVKCCLACTKRRSHIYLSEASSLSPMLSCALKSFAYSTADTSSIILTQTTIVSACGPPLKGCLLSLYSWQGSGISE